MHATCPLRSGVTVRLNIPSYSRHNVWSQTYKRNHAGNDFSDAAQAACSDDVMIRQLLAKREIAKSEQFNVLMVLSIALYQIVSNVRMPDTSRSRVQAPSSERSTKGSSVHRQTYAVFFFAYESAYSVPLVVPIQNVQMTSRCIVIRMHHHVSGPRVNDSDLPLDSASKRSTCSSPSLRKRVQLCPDCPPHFSKMPSGCLRPSRPA
jgi:hypothetical protein